jgi:hypothetical protein
MNASTIKQLNAPKQPDYSKLYEAASSLTNKQLDRQIIAIGLTVATGGIIALCSWLS